MLNIVLQLWGGIFYFLNKIFLAFGEKSKNKNMVKSLKISGWSVYLIGLPAWLWILLSKNDFIVASIEAGGIMSMILGLISAIKGKENIKPWLSQVAKIMTYLMLVFGIIASLYIFNGISELSQILELGVTVGFLLGTYNLAKENSSGWLWFGLMNASNAALMGIQDNHYLLAQ